MKTIYYLYEIGENIPRYIGLTKQLLKDRLKSHKCSKGKTKREQWIRKALSGGGLGIKQVEQVEDNIAYEREAYWTNFYPDLVNLRIGTKANQELRAIQSVAQKLKPINWEALRKTHAKVRGMKRSEDFCRRMSLAQKDKPKNPLSVAKMKSHHTEKYGKRITIDGVSYTSISEAARQSGVHKSTIQAVLAGRMRSSNHQILYA